MSLDPAVAQKLMKELPELQEFRAFLVEEAQALNTLQGMENWTGQDVAVEVRARLRAFETIKRILRPLIDTGEVRTGTPIGEYVV